MIDDETLSVNTNTNDQNQNRESHDEIVRLESSANIPLLLWSLYSAKKNVARSFCHEICIICKMVLSLLTSNQPTQYDDVAS